MQLYDVKRLLLQPYLALQRRRYGPPGSIQYKILERLNFSPAALRFLRDSADHAPVLKANLGPDSLVWDVGGFNGEWAAGVVQRYDCHVWIFEPNPKMVAFLNQRFEGYEKVRIFPVALGDADGNVRLQMQGAGSAVVKDDHSAQGTQVEVQQQDASKLFEASGRPDITLLKVNIEGGEYSLLPHLLQAGIINQCEIVRIQFHEWIPGAYRNRRRIVKALEQSHRIEWSYRFVWESWVRRS